MNILLADGIESLHPAAQVVAVIGIVIVVVVFIVYAFGD